MQTPVTRWKHYDNRLLCQLLVYYCTTILKAVQETPKSSMEICVESMIPISTISRRVQTLHDLGLLKVSGSISGDGKKYFLYKSKVKSIEAKFDGEIKVEIKLG